MQVVLSSECHSLCFLAHVMWADDGSEIDKTNNNLQLVKESVCAVLTT